MREFIDGSAAIVRGALDAGCDFFAGYPITPASPILMQMLRELPKVRGVAVQGEDEIASIGMCLGATLAGARAMTATSGPGLSLYSESIGLAIMGEVPLVIVDVQRLGPATGGATTVGQGDVQFVRWGTSGGYPVIALAPSSVAECYTLTRDAFSLAERFRCPVFIVTDKELSMTATTVDVECFEVAPDPKIAQRVAAGVPSEGASHSRVPEEDSDTGTGPPRTPFSVMTPGTLLGPGNDSAASRPADSPPPVPYRYEPADQVPPLLLYGQGSLVRFTGSTHDERALITKDPAKVSQLNEHLRAKIEMHVDEIVRVKADLEPGATTLWISFGVTAGAMREAVLRVRASGRKVSALTVQSLWPVPERAILDAITGMERIVVAELNHGQYRREIERLVPGQRVQGLHRVDGELITPEQFEETLG